MELAAGAAPVSRASKHAAELQSLQRAWDATLLCWEGAYCFANCAVVVLLCDHYESSILWASRQLVLSCMFFLSRSSTCNLTLLDIV
jgi:hypothetical protein